MHSMSGSEQFLKQVCTSQSLITGTVYFTRQSNLYFTIQVLSRTTFLSQPIFNPFNNKSKFSGKFETFLDAQSNQSHSMLFGRGITHTFSLDLIMTHLPVNDSG